MQTSAALPAPVILACFMILSPLANPLPTTSTECISNCRSRHSGSLRSRSGSERQICRAVESGVCAETGAFDARGIVTVNEGSAGGFRSHGRLEQLPGSGHAAAQQVQREIERV